jgi:predicted PurR-regulated permease PerM
VSIHPLEIFLVILIAGFSFGILGMIAAVPCLHFKSEGRIFLQQGNSNAIN